METVLELEIPARPEYVAIVRLVVSSFASARRALVDERVDDLKLAVSEACTNAIEAHRGASVEGPVTVKVVEGADRLEVHITDRGPGFEPDRLPEHPPVTDPDRLNFERGLGIPLIRTLVDDVVFESNVQAVGKEASRDHDAPLGTSVRLVLFGGPSGDTNDMTVEILRSVLSEDG